MVVHPAVLVVVIHLIDVRDMIHYIFNKPINIKTFNCTGKCTDPRVNIFVRITDKCNANCKFCSDKSCNEIPKEFNVRKLVDIIDEIEKNQISVNKLNITGGEPSMAPSVRLLSLLESVPDHIHIHLNTNGISDKSRDLMKLDRWNSISMSVHHYKIPKIMEIYGINDIPTNYLNFDGINLSKVNFSCNLIKGYIDNYNDILKFCESSRIIGIKRVGFVGLMPINQYSKDNNIRYHHLPIRKADLENGWNWVGSLCRSRVCNCRNYRYKGMEVYFRETLDPSYNESALVYDGQNLYQGFNSKEVII